jgi:hypothetical protein
MIAAIEKVLIYSVQLLYTRTEFRFEAVVKSDKFFESGVPPALFWGVYTAADRTDMIRFRRGRVGKFQIQLVSDNPHVPVLFIIACYLDDRFATWRHIVTAELRH